MESSNTIYAIILLLGAAHGVFLGFALLAVDTGNRIALRLLAALTLTFSLDLAINYLYVAGHLAQFPRLRFIESVAAFLYGPLLYFYVVALTSTQVFRMTWQRWLHFAPFIASILLLIPYLRLSDASLVGMIYDGADPGPELGGWAIGMPIVDSLPRLLIGAYLVLGFLRLAKHGRNIREQFSLIEHISLRWLRNLLLAIGILWVLYAIALAYGGAGPVEQLLNVVIVVVVYTLGYMGMRQPDIFKQQDRREEVTSDVDERTSDKPKYERSALDAEMSAALLEELQTVMLDERPYLDAKLTLSQLAERLGISTNYLSQIINQQTSSNFFDYINSHRVEAAKQILADPDKARLSVLAIAMDAGFNSKSAFYSAFKQHAHMTPSQFRQKYLS